MIERQITRQSNEFGSVPIVVSKCSLLIWSHILRTKLTNHEDVPSRSPRGGKGANGCREFQCKCIVVSLDDVGSCWKTPRLGDGEASGTLVSCDDASKRSSPSPHPHAETIPLCTGYLTQRNLLGSYAHDIAHGSFPRCGVAVRSDRAVAWRGKREKE